EEIGRVEVFATGDLGFAICDFIESTNHSITNHQIAQLRSQALFLYICRSLFQVRRLILIRLIAFLLTIAIFASAQQTSTPSSNQSTQAPAPEKKPAKTSKPGTKKESDEDVAKAQASEKAQAG